MSSDMDSTKLIQVANIAPQTTKEQMHNIFSFVGKIDDIRLYPTMDLGVQITSKICFVKFHDSSSITIAQHLTNTVFIDRALVVIPLMETEIPDEVKGLELLTSGTMLPGIADPKLPQHVTSQLEGFPPHQVVSTYDPKLAEAGLPMYPPLPNNYDTRKIEEIRRTIMVANLDNELSSQHILDYFNQNCKEVKYFRLCTRDNDPLRYALIEFTEQPSVIEALKQNGMKLGNKRIKVYHAVQAIVKPQAKTNETAQKEIEDAMSRQAQTILSQGIDVSTAATPHLGAPVIKEKRRSRSRHRSRDRYSGSSRRRRSRSSSRRRSDYKHRSRSRDRVSRKRSRSRDHYSSRKRSHSKSRSPTSHSRRSRSRSSRRDDKKSSSSSSKKYKEKDRKKDDKRDRDRKEDRRDRDKDDKKDDRKDKKDRRDKEKDEKKESKSKDRDGTVKNAERDEKVKDRKEEISQNGKENGKE